MTARVGGRAGTRVSWAVVVPALRSNRNPWRPGQPAKNSLQVQLVFPLRAGRQDSRENNEWCEPLWNRERKRSNAWEQEIMCKTDKSRGNTKGKTNHGEMEVSFCSTVCAQT